MSIFVSSGMLQFKRYNCCHIEAVHHEGMGFKPLLTLYTTLVLLERDLITLILAGCGEERKEEKAILSLLRSGVW